MLVSFVRLMFVASFVVSLPRIALGQSADPVNAEGRRSEEPRRNQDGPTVVKPKLLGAASLDYPEGAQGDANVVLELVIAVEGSVAEATVVDGQEPFATAARSAALGWTFSPARVDGKPLAVRILFHAQFKAPRLIAPPLPRETRSPQLPPPDGQTHVIPASQGTAPTVHGSTAEQKEVAIVVTGTREPASVRVVPDAITSIIPGAEGDPIRALDAVPGTVPILASGPFLGLRGSPPGKIGYEFDGIRLPYIVHLARAAGVVHPWLVESASVFGAGPSRLGRATGGLFEARAADPERRFRGSARVRVTDSAAGAEAPFADGRGSVLVAGRYSYTQGLVSLVAPSFSLNFWDYQARADYEVTSSDSIELLALGAGDTSAQTDDDGVTEDIFNGSFHRVRLSWRRQRDDGTQTRVSVLYSHDRWDASPSPENPKSHSVTARVETEVAATRTSRVLMGADAVARLQYDFYELGGSGSEQWREFQRDDLDASTWVDWIYAPNRDLTLALGLRGDVFGSGESPVTAAATELSVGPRYSLSYRLNEWLRLHQAFGLASQRPSPSQRTPGHVYSCAGGLEYSALGDVGVEVKLPLDVVFDVTGFAGVFFDTDDVSMLINLEGQPEGLERGDGRSIGMEASLQRAFGRHLRGLISYTLSRAERWVGRALGPARYDRTHIFDAALGYDFGGGWSISGRTTYYTGFPGQVSTIVEAQSPPRSSPYLQFDVQAEKRWRIGGDGAWIAATVGMLNVGLQKDSIELDCTSGVCDENLVGPAALPTLGVEGAI